MPKSKSIIQCYGLHWRKDWIEWGKQNVPGTLLGKERGKRDEVDFRDQTGVYALYAEFELVYIGQTTSKAGLLTRLRNHRDDHLSERWSRFSWFGTRRVHRRKLVDRAPQLNSEEIVNALEAVCIAIAEPRLNLQRGGWGRATQYHHVPREDY